MGVKVDTSEWKKFESKLKTLTSAQTAQFMAQASKEMGLRLLSLVIPRTPVGGYTNVTYKKKINGYKKNGEQITRTVTSIHQGGDLRRGWNANYASLNNVTVISRRAGAEYQVNIENASHYASYVEYGHRQTPGRFVPTIGKRLKNSWVNGQFFLRASEEDLTAQAPSILKKSVDDFLKDVF